MKKLIIDRFAAYILGSTVWGHLQAIVHIVEDPNKSGQQKRSEAIENFGKLGLSIAGFLLNLGLELAVAKLRSK